MIKKNAGGRFRPPITPVRARIILVESYSFPDTLTIRAAYGAQLKCEKLTLIDTERRTGGPFSVINQLYG